MFTPEFKRQIVQLYEGSKARGDIVREYDLTEYTLVRWIQESEWSGSFSEKANRSPQIHSERAVCRCGERFDYVRVAGKELFTKAMTAGGEGGTSRSNQAITCQEMYGMNERILLWRTKPSKSYAADLKGLSA